MAEPWVLGIGASHNGGACLLQGDRIVVAIQEERLARQKRVYVHAGLPSLAADYCLRAAGLTAADLSSVVACTQQPSSEAPNDVAANPQFAVNAARGDTHHLSHHLGHALSVFMTSGYDEAAVLVIDGLGSPWSDLDDAERATCIGHEKGWESVSIYRASGSDLVPLEKHLAPDLYLDPDGGPYVWGAASPGMPRFRTLGGLYSAVSWQLFEHGLEGPGKTMSLAGLNTPSHPVSDFLEMGETGPITFSDAVPAAFTHDERWPDRENEYTALAASAQAALEHAVVALADRALRLSGSRRLCFAGGVALNGIINETLARRYGPENVFVVPAAEDSGTALGAAFAGAARLGVSRPVRRVVHDFHGAAYSASEVAATARSTGLVTVQEDPEPWRSAARRIADGQVVGWFGDGAEFGPRALGHRSILADPRRLENKVLLNSRLKRREDFRPFAPAVMHDHASEWFDIENDPGSPFMLRVVGARPERADRIPAVIHTDGTARVQSVAPASNPALYRLLEEFHRLTGIPMLLNTSMNGRGEPIVELPREAMMLAVTAPLDAVYFGSLVAEPLVHDLGGLVPVPVDGLSIERQSEVVRTPLDDVDSSDLRATVPTPWGDAAQQIDAATVDLLSRLGGETIDELVASGRSTEAELVGLQRAGLLRLTRR